jgi:tRNA synthetases class II core domain (F)
VSSPVSYLDPAQLQRDLGMRDLSEPAEGPHAIQVLTRQAVERLCGAWKCEVRWCRGPRIVPVADNYDRLGYPAEAITRETRYTRYVDAGRMLRSHSSAMIPPALRRLARQPGDDVLLACPGIVYRRDAIDWQHTGTPHQLDLWRITQRAMSGTDMDQMIAVLLGALICPACARGRGSRDSGMVCTRTPNPSRPGARRSTVWTVKARMNAVRALGRQLHKDGIEIVTLESTSTTGVSGSSSWRRAGWRCSWSTRPRPRTCPGGRKRTRLPAPQAAAGRGPAAGVLDPARAHPGVLGAAGAVSRPAGRAHRLGAADPRGVLPSGRARAG